MTDEDSKQVVTELRKLREQLAGEHLENRDELGALRDEMSDLRRAFPDGDPDGHRRYHEAVIAEKEARRALWADVQTKLIEKGLWAALMVLAGALVMYFRSKGP